MKPVSARASYNDRVLKQLFSSSKRAHDTATKVLDARSSSSGRFVSFGLTLSTDKSKKKKSDAVASGLVKRAKT